VGFSHRTHTERERERTVDQMTNDQIA
jgi:hypothetical protein